MNLYEAQNDGWMMPALLNNDNAAAMAGGGTAATHSRDDHLRNRVLLVVTPESDTPACLTWYLIGQIQKLLDCPAVNHPKGWGPTAEGGNGKWSLDYTYNQMLGSNSAAPGAPPVFEYPFVKATDLRRETLVATEVRDITNVHDYVFNGRHSFTRPDQQDQHRRLPGHRRHAPSRRHIRQHALRRRSDCHR